jgi:hypothetical protein
LSAGRFGPDAIQGLFAEAAPLAASGPQTASLFQGWRYPPLRSGLAFAADAGGFASRLS